MINKDFFEKKEYKKLLFEYLVFQLVNWAKEQDPTCVPIFTKLRLQKILFLVSARKATIERPALLSVFNNFFALPYGPVEMDIYESMKGSSAFQHIGFNDTDCICNNLAADMFLSISNEDKTLIDDTIAEFKSLGFNYLTRPVFELVNISHQWTAWQVAMNMAKMLSSNKEEMSTESICNSRVKAF